MLGGNPGQLSSLVRTFSPELVRGWNLVLFHGPCWTGRQLLHSANTPSHHPSIKNFYSLEFLISNPITALSVKLSVVFLSIFL